MEWPAGRAPARGGGWSPGCAEGFLARSAARPRWTRSRWTRCRGARAQLRRLPGHPARRAARLSAARAADAAARAAGGPHRIAPPFPGRLLTEIIIVRARGRATAARARQAGRDAAARPAPPPYLVPPSATGASGAGGSVLEQAAGWSLEEVAGWSLAAALAARTGRGRVRVADLDATGAARNAYHREIPVDGPPPHRPYAVYLADIDGGYRLLGLDLDSGRGPVAADLAELRALLDRAGLPHLVCASGPFGGRHVWIGLAEAVPAPEVARLADALAARLPSLDTAPLRNPATGCLRPPGAPHRITG